MTTKLIILILFISNILANADDYFKTSNGSQMLAGTIYVQFKRGTYTTDLATIQLGGKYKVGNSILKKEQSLTFNKSKANSVQSSSEIISAEEPLLRTFYVEFDKKLNPEKVAYHLMRTNPNVEYAEPQYVGQLAKNNSNPLPKKEDNSQILTPYTPNDPLVNKQKMLTQISAFAAWEIEKGNPNVVIGVSDEGLNQNHPDLKPSLYLNTKDPINGKDDDGDGYIDNYNGYNFKPLNANDWSNTINTDSHGTEVSGIIGAKFNNGIGIAGVAGNCTLFPLKISPTGTSTVTSGYESIIAAANMGFIKVINCSWANATLPNYSALRQNIVNYAVAKDLVIVTVSGNTDFKNGAAKYRSYMPGFYYGTLGTGEVDTDDNITDNSGLGQACKIMAPGLDNYTTSGNSYTNVGSGTSYASPVVAGAMGIVRSKYPKMKAMQAINFLRQCTDEINNLNMDYPEQMPGRLNLYKAVTIDPFSIPGFAITEVKKTDLSLDNEKKVFNVGDVFVLNVKMKNFLGYANNVGFFAKTVYNNTEQAVSITKSSADFANVKPEDEVIFPIEIKLNKIKTDKILIRIDVYGDNNYHDILFLDFYAFPEVFDYQNDAIQVSAGLRGTFGFNSTDFTRQGFGFNLLGYGDALYQGGLLLTTNNAFAISSNDGFGTDFNDFGISSNIYNNGTDTIQVIGNFSSDLSVKVSENIELPKGNKNFVKVHIKAENTSQFTMQDFSIGYKLDWDIGYKDEGYQFNLGALLDSDLPDILKFDNRGGNIFKNKDEEVTFGAAVKTNETNGFAQIANLNSTVSNETSQLVKALNSDKKWILNSTTDIFSIVGMKFNGDFAPNQTKECTICIAGAKNADDFKKAIRECIDPNSSVITEYKSDNKLTITENNNVISISSQMEESSIQLFDMLGRNVGTWTNTTQVLLDKSILQTGIYFVTTPKSSQKFVISE